MRSTSSVSCEIHAAKPFARHRIVPLRTAPPTLAPRPSGLLGIVFRRGKIFTATIHIGVPLPESPAPMPPPFPSAFFPADEGEAAREKADLRCFRDAARFMLVAWAISSLPVTCSHMQAGRSGPWS